MPNNTPRHYTIGSDLCAPFTVTLTINAGEVTLEQFRADLPNITRQLEKHITTSRAEASRSWRRMPNSRKLLQMWCMLKPGIRRLLTVPGLKPMEIREKTIGARAMKITEEELQRRLAAMPKTRTAGPDDPIYSSGLTVTSFPRLKQSTKTSQTDTVGGEQNSAPPEGDMSDLKVAGRIQDRIDQFLDNLYASKMGK